MVLTPRCWRQVCGVASAQPGLDKNISADDGGKTARSPGRARRKPLKPLRAGTSGDSGVLVVTRVRSITTSAHEAAGAKGTRRSPRPLWAEDSSTPRALRVARAKLFQMNRNAPHSPPSSPAKAGDPVFRGVNDEVEKPQRTGYSAGACHRARRRRDPVAEYDDLCEERLVRRSSTKAELLRPRSPVIGAHSRDPLASRNDEWGNRFSDNGDVTTGPLPTD